jgi:hypothetical protein
MQILLNGLDLARRAEGDQTVGEVLAQVQDEVRAGGRIVTQVALDGEPLPAGGQRRQRLSASVDSVQRLDLTVEDPLQLKHRTLIDASSLTRQLVERAKPLSRSFRVGDEVRANNDLASFLEDMKLVLAGMDHTTREVRQDGTPMPVRNRVIESANRLLPSLDRLYQAQAGGDHVAIADEIEYDLCDQLNTWGDLLREVKASLNPLPQDQ